MLMMIITLEFSNFFLSIIEKYEIYKIAMISWFFTGPFEDETEYKRAFTPFATDSRAHTVIPASSLHLPQGNMDLESEYNLVN